MTKNRKKTVRKTFREKTAGSQVKNHSPCDGGPTFASTVSRLKPRGVGYVAGENW